MKTLLLGLAALFLLPLCFFSAGLSQLGGLSGQRSQSEGNTEFVMPISGPVYPASTLAWSSNNTDNRSLLGKVSIHDLGFGPSDANRINRVIARINPASPLGGKGQLILEAAQASHVDPLLLVGVWDLESQLDTDGLNVPTNGGNMTWSAMREASELYGCTPGPSSLGHRWGRCPSVQAGVRIWFDYVGAYYPRRGAASLRAFAGTYNPCSDRVNAARGFDCGESYGLKVLGIIRANASPPVTLPVQFLADYPSPAGSIPWYRYQGEYDSYDPERNQNTNCGPTSTAMAIEWYTALRVPISALRMRIGRDGDTSILDNARLLDYYHVPYRLDIADAHDIEAALERGSIVEVAGNMGAVSPGPDADGASNDPRLRTGRYYTAQFLHIFIVRGITPDGRYFIVEDPMVWGSHGASAEYWYSNGQPKGEDRLYPINEVEGAMAYFGDGIKGMEVPAPPNRAISSERS